MSIFGMIKNGRRKMLGLSRTPTVIDLFCGAGGFAEGFRQAGFFSIVGNDNDAWAGASFSYNHSRYGTKFVLGDIREREVHDEVLDAVRGVPVDVVIGGPPCQAFSQVRNHKRIIDDPRNSLYREFVAMVGAVRPKVFVMENVPGLQNLAGGVVRQQIIEDLGLEGEYQVTSGIVDAADFGVPQNRLRVIFVGVRSDLKIEPCLPAAPTVANLLALRRTDEGIYVPDVARSMFARTALDDLLDPGNLTFVTVAQAISDLSHLRPSERLVRKPSDASVPYELEPQSAYQRERRSGSASLYNADCPSIREDTVNRLQAIPQGGNFRDIPEVLQRRYLNGKKWGPELGRQNLSRKYFFAYRKLHPDFFSWTLNTKADCVYHYGIPRALTVREFARLHSFDDSYHFLSGDRHSRYRQIGNAVPPLMGKAIGDVVAGILQTAEEAQGPHQPSLKIAAKT